MSIVLAILGRLGPIGWAAVALAALLGVTRIQLALAHHEIKAAQGQAVDARGKLATCSASVAAQNASLAAQARTSAAALKAATDDLAAAQGQSDRYRTQAAALRAHKPAGATQCERWEDAYKAVLENSR